MNRKKSICLVMIVRNEERVIERCLNRVKDYVDYWIIVDTGSTDRTKQLIEKNLVDIPGELHSEEWVNFGYNRTQSLQLAKGKADYLLLCDADEQILFDSHFDSSLLEKDAYLLSYLGTNDYAVPYLLKGDRDWFYVGVTHEYLDCNGPFEREKLNSIAILDLQDGGFKHDKFTRDIALLEEGLKEEPTNSRYKFYLANSYRDNGQLQEAAKWYQRRIDDGGWVEEVTVSYENLGKAYEELGQNEKAIATWLAGYDYNPKRMECLYYAVRRFRIDGKPRLGYQLCKIAKEIAYPVEDVLFVKRDIYEYWIDYEMSICAYYVGDYRQGFESCQSVLLKKPQGAILETSLRNFGYYIEYAQYATVESLIYLASMYEQFLQKHENQEIEKIKDSLQVILASKMQKETSI